MSHERLVGLNVIDERLYQQYRKAMRPILSAHGGRFGYDFKVSEVLLAEESCEINRVFTLNFPDRGMMEAFFSNPDYLAVREKYFEPSVGAATIISTYEKDT